MKAKTKNNIRAARFVQPALHNNGRGVLGFWQRTVAILIIMAMVTTWAFLPVKPVRAVGIDNVVASVPEGSDGTGAAAQVTVAFETSVLVDTEAFTIYLGEDTTGDEWGLNAVTTADISCTDNGTGEAYTVNSVTAASATLPMRTQITATTVGAAATTVTCLIGDASPNPTNPTVADGYSVAVTTSADSGAGVIYIGDANDVTVSVTVLPNLTLTVGGTNGVDNDGTNCTTSSGVTTCNLGTVLTTTVVSGSYDLQVGTNATGGATINIAESGDLGTITDFVEDSGTITAGIDEYGISVAEDGAWTFSGIYLDNDSPIEASTALATSGGPISSTGDDVTVTHKVAVSSLVAAGSHSHTVVWTATANF